MLLQEVLQTTHPKYCRFSLVTGFYLLFELAGAGGIEAITSANSDRFAFPTAPAHGDAQPRSTKSYKCYKKEVHL